MLARFRNPVYLTNRVVCKNAFLSSPYDLWSQSQIPSRLPDQHFLIACDQKLPLITQHSLDERNISRGNIFHAAQVTLTLRALLRQDVIPEGLLVLVAFRGFTEPLGRTTGGFHFGHFHTPHSKFKSYGLSAANQQRDRSSTGFRAYSDWLALASAVPFFLLFGANTMVSCLPSIFGNISTVPISARSFSIRFNRSIPSSWCAISRPRKRSVT